MHRKSWPFDFGVAVGVEIGPERGLWGLGGVGRGEVEDGRARAFWETVETQNVPIRRWTSM